MNKALHHTNQHMGAFLKQILGSGLPLLTGTGNPEARLLIAYDMPSREDITAASPFHRPENRLDEMLKETGISTEDTYRTYIIKFVPQGKRPSYEEEALSLPWFAKEIETVHPKAVILLGATALSMLGIHEPLAKVYGQAMQLELYGTSCSMVPLHHPDRLRQADMEAFRAGLRTAARMIYDTDRYPS